MAAKRGKFILFEGLDRSGKSTQTRLLLNAIRQRGKQAEQLSFPDRKTLIGKLIGDYLRGSSKPASSEGKDKIQIENSETLVDEKSKDIKQTENESVLDDKAIHLLFSANRWEKQTLMRKLLDSGVDLVVDRYIYSGIAFSCAKGMDFDWCKAPDVGLIAPDLVVFLNVNIEESTAREGFGSERYETRQFQSLVLKQFQKLEKMAVPQSSNHSLDVVSQQPLWITINASQSIDSISKSVISYYNSLQDKSPGDYFIFK
ncbi:hypothetical protein BB560_000166 [Smittium megazygosporum]|uniref:dTMP kinase n=1 Tax=Smittium megazygosporum TaxID=133381 RepID=A0A2T9ZL92_9FUNG|nr:hypothetical protein BB560_000166 [Smittium megazygosporum]